ncbi:MAG: hypothetical protein WA652_13280 [Xanthobacteraceae bacterium]
MAEYHTVIARAVSELAANNPEARQDVYERARKTFDLVVQGRQPQITALEILHQQVALEDAIRKVEADALSPSPPPVQQKRSEEFTDLAAVSLPKTKTRRRLVLSWALTSAVWCTFLGEYAYQDYKIRHPLGTPIQQRCPDAVPDPIINLTPWCLGSLPESASRASQTPGLVYVMVGLAPPIALFAFGGLLYWTLPRSSLKVGMPT